MDGDRLLAAMAAVLGFDEPSLTFAQTAAQAGVDERLARRYWRAMGFPDVPADEAAFGPADVEALRLATQFVHDEAAVERSLGQTRVVASALARIAETWLDPLRQWHGAGVRWDDLTDMFVREWEADRIAQLVDYVHRRQVLAAVRREVAIGAGHVRELAVGFVDLVDWTGLSRRLDASELAELIARFEAVAYDTIAERSGRFVKLIGDEVLFTADDLDGAIAIAARLVHAPGLPAVRAGVAAGAVLIQEGDVYGPAVNLAHRAAAVAEPGTIVTDRAVPGASDLGDRQLKGIGVVRLWCLRS